MPERGYIPDACEQPRRDAAVAPPPRHDTAGSKRRSRGRTGTQRGIGAESTQMLLDRADEHAQESEDSSFVAASDGTITWANDAAERMFGDLRGRSFTTVVVPED